MRLGVRGRMFFVSLSLFVVVGVISGLYLESTLRRLIEARVESELFRHGRTLVEILASTVTATDSAGFDDIADRMGKASDIRVTIIDRVGAVLGDSEIALHHLATTDKHHKRPEIQQALGQGRGSSRRRSGTLDTEMLYAALPFYQGGEVAGVVRVAMPLDEVDTAVERLRYLVVGAGMLGLGLAVIVSALASHVLSNAFRKIMQQAHSLASAEDFVEGKKNDEFGQLAGSLHRMAEQLQNTVATLASERDRFETVLEDMSEAVLSLDRDLKISVLNPAARKLLQLSDDAIGHTLVEMLDVPVLHVLVERGQKSRAESEFQLPARNRFVLAKAAPLKASFGVVVVMLDITKIRRLETIRRDFVANVSHELRTPISVIQANAETLLDGAIDDQAKARSFLAAIMRHAQRLSSLVADILDLSRIEAGKFPLNISALNLDEVVDNVVSHLADAAISKKMTLRTDIPAGLQIQADAKALEQVLSNLLENAIKYTPDAGHVIVKAAEKGDFVRIEVIDDGPGIAEKHQPRVFERFYRVDPGRSRAQGGTGLGLAIVKHLVESMQGRVGVESELEKGSIFWLHLPRVHLV